MIKKIAKVSVLAVALLLSGCGGDNAYNGTGVISPKTAPSKGNALASLEENVFIKDSESLLSSVTTLKTQVESFDTDLTQSDVKQMQNTFRELMEAWKSVQNTYVAADYDNAMIDIPQLFDFYHTGKKLDVPADIDQALASSSSIEDALFKSSSKSITALEYLLFGYSQSVAEMTELMNIDKRRRISALEVVLANLKGLSAKIADFYKNDIQFSSNEEDAANSIVNVLIDSSFKLKEWRIGESAGISIKFKDDPDPERLEYFKSVLSTEAIESILEAHQSVMGKQSYANFGTFASQNGAAVVVKKILEKLDEAESIVQSFGKPIEELITTTSVDPKINTLYTTIKVLQDLYFESLIQALDLTAEIIEADGD
ncbi:MAG: hypothetical protein COB07_04275 [Sulfurovum sp.]|nr:MAG: hypothetical protein COB07_04275 [Sulfurovum sp.]